MEREIKEEIQSLSGYQIRTLFNRAQYRTMATDIVKGYITFLEEEMKKYPTGVDLKAVAEAVMMASISKAIPPRAIKQIRPYKAPFRELQTRAEQLKVMTNEQFLVLSELVLDAYIGGLLRVIDTYRSDDRTICRLHILNTKQEYMKFLGKENKEENQDEDTETTV